MKKFFCVLLVAVMLFCVLPVGAAAELTAQSDYDIDLENIGMGGGGQITWVLIDPLDPNIYYCACDMGGLYNSTNKGASWSRIPTEGYVNTICADEEGVLFFGGYGLYKSDDRGNSSERIYPKDIYYSISRCGWNEKLMLADGFNLDYVLSVVTYGDTVYFATSDYLGNIRYLCCDKQGNNLTVMGTGYLNASPTNMRFRAVADDSGIYFSDGYAIRCIDPESFTITTVFEANGFINDFAKIENKFIILDDTDDCTRILCTEDFSVYTDLMDYNTLPDRFYVYGYPRYFKWRLQHIAGNNYNNIYFAFCDMSVINADGILKFNGSSFEWVFDGMDNNRAAVGADGWSFGSVRPVYDICADPHDDNHMLLSVETVYDVHFTSPDTRIVKTAHCIDYPDGSYGTKGLDVLATYAVKEDPFNSDHIIINCADVGIQNSFNAGQSFVRATIQGEDYARYNSCYDLYFDPHTEGKIYALWSSIHEVPTHTDRIDKKYATGYLAVSYDGGYTWDFEYSDLPRNSIPFKMSVEERDGELIIAVATFNNGFFISYDSGRHFESISGGMEPITTSISGYEQDTADYIFGVDVKLAGDKVYCLAHHHSSSSGIIPAKLYEYTISTNETKKIDLGDEIVIAKSLTYSEEKGLFVNVVPYYKSRWLLDLDTFFWFNYGGGIYKVENYGVRRIFDHENGIFNSGFAPDGKMYAVAIHGEVFVEEDGVFKPYVTGLFKQLMNVCFSPDGKKMYVTTSGGGTYRMNALRDEEHIHCVCGNEICTEHGGNCELTPLERVLDGTNQLTSGSYYLTDDLTVENSIDIAGDVTICLNGHVLACRTGEYGAAHGIDLEQGSTLNICDCNGTTEHRFEPNQEHGHWNTAESTGSKSFNGGVIFGGGVAVNTSSTFNMYGGGIVGNIAMGADDSPVRILGGTFNMHGGQIVGNNASYGGGVYNSGVFNMYGGSITDNFSNYSGGGVYADEYNNGILNISGNAVIENNKRSNGAVNNVELADGAYINILDTLGDNASIGITTATPPTQDTPVKIAEGSGYTAKSSDAEKLFADADGRIVEFNDSDKCVYLALDAPEEPPVEMVTIRVNVTGDGSAKLNGKDLASSDAVLVEKGQPFTVSAVESELFEGFYITTPGTKWKYVDNLDGIIAGTDMSITVSFADPTLADSGVKHIAFLTDDSLKFTFLATLDLGDGYDTWESMPNSDDILRHKYISFVGWSFDRDCAPDNAMNDKQLQAAIDESPQTSFIVYAIYDDTDEITLPTQTANITMTSDVITDDGVRNVYFDANIQVQPGFKAIQAGVIITKLSDYANEENMTTDLFNTSGVIVSRVSSIGEDGYVLDNLLYSCAVTTASGTVYGRGYIVLKNFETGEIITEYTDIFSGTI